MDIASSADTGEQSEHLSLPQMEELLQLLLRCCQNSSQVALRLSQKQSLSLLLRLMGNRRSSSIIVLTLRITRHVFPKLKCRVLAQVMNVQFYVNFWTDRKEAETCALIFVVSVVGSMSAFAY